MPYQPLLYPICNDQAVIANNAADREFTGGNWPSRGVSLGQYCLRGVAEIMGAEPRRNGTDQPQRVASLAAMCRELTAELFDEPALPEPPRTTPLEVPAELEAQPAVVPQPAPERRPDLIIPPAQAPARTVSARTMGDPTPATVPGMPALNDRPDAPIADAGARHLAERSLADLRPRRFDTAADVPTVRALEPARAQSLPSAVGRASKRPSISQLSNRQLNPRDDDLDAQPEIPGFLGPTPLTVEEGDRPAAVRADTGRSLFARLPVRGLKRPSAGPLLKLGRTQPPPAKAEHGRPLRIGPPEQPLATSPSDREVTKKSKKRSKTKSRRKARIKVGHVPVGALTGLTVFLAVAGAAVAGVAVAPRIAELVGPANAPHIEVAEVEGIADALVPLPLIVDAATGTTLSSVVIDGVPIGARLNAGRSSGDGSWILPPDALPNLALVPPRGFAGEMSLLVSAVAVDGLERVHQTVTMRITIIPHNRTPQIHASRRI